MNDIKQHILKQVCSYLYDNGISIDYNILTKHIILEPNFNTLLDSKPKIMFKPKSKIKREPKLDCETKIKREPNLDSKPKIMFKPKSIFRIFIDLCKLHNIPYFNFNDINSWNGPAIKFNDTSIFKSLNTTIINGYGFKIIRPTSQCKNDFVYPKYNDTLDTHSLIVNYSDNEEDMSEELELDEWFFHDVKYLIDESNNILYSDQTHERIGKKIDEFNIQLF